MSNPHPGSWHFLLSEGDIAPYLPWNHTLESQSGRSNVTKLLCHLLKVSKMTRVISIIAVLLKCATKNVHITYSSRTTCYVFQQEGNAESFSLRYWQVGLAKCHVCSFENASSWIEVKVNFDSLRAVGGSHEVISFVNVLQTKWRSLIKSFSALRCKTKCDHT